MSEAPQAPASDRRRIFYVYAALVAAVVALYSYVFHCQFIDFDDTTHVTGNSCVLAGLHFPSIGWAFTHYIACQWMPLTWISHQIDVSLFGMDPGLHHLGNVLFHAINSCLVFAAFRRLTKEFWASAAVAALFAVHPINVESVAWIAERKNVLSTLFWLLAMLAYVRHVEEPRRGWMWVVSACMALGLMSKGMPVTLPCALLLLDYWPLGRDRTTSWLQLFKEKIPLFVLSAAGSVVTIAAGAHDHGLLSSHALSVSGRFSNAITGYIAYLKLLFWPAHLAPLYPIEASHPAREVIGSLAILGAVTAVLFGLRKRMPFLLMGWLWFLGVLVPVTSVFQIGSQAYADRFAYIPELGLFWAVVWSVKMLPRPALRWCLAGAAAVIVALSMLTVRQVGYWTDSVTLFEYDISVTEDNGVAQAVAGMGCVRRGEYPRAIAHYREAKRLMPWMAEVRSLLAEALTHTGQNDEALEQLRAAVALDPTDKHARRNLVAMLVNKGRMAEAAKIIPH
jgi:tetratricopeptide (TPR) repeat protein